MNVTALLLADSRFPGGGHAHSGGLEEAASRGLVRTEADLPAFLRNRLRTAGALAAVFAAAAARPDVDWLALDAELDARTPSAAQRAASRAQGKATARAAKAMLATADETVRKSHSLAQGPPDFNATGGDRQFSAARGGDGRQGDGLSAVGPQVAGLPVAAPRDAGLVAAVLRGTGPRVAGLLAAVPRPHHCVLLGVLAGVPADAALTAAYLSVSGPASASVRLLGLDPLLVNAIVAALGPDIAAIAEAAAAAADLDLANLPAPGFPGLDVLAEEHDRHHREEVRLFAS